jgi:hypothetical protein
MDQVLFVEITKEDMRRAEPCQATRCVLARALNRQFPTRIGWAVGLSTAYSEGLRYVLSDEAAAFVAAFDLGLAPNDIALPRTLIMVRE